METWDNAQPDQDRMIKGGSGIPDARAGVGSDDASDPASGSVSGAGPGAGDGDAAAGPADALTEAERELHRALSAAAEGIASAPHSMYPKVMARATRIRRRRRAVRAGSATAVLVMAAVLGPSIASQMGVRGADASAAPPPSAIVDLTSAYPVPESSGGQAVATPTTQPDNALAWPSRGVAVPAQAADVAKSFLLDHAASGTAATATVETLWAQIEDDPTKGAASKPGTVNAHKTWLYVMQGWTVAPDGAPSDAELLVGDYTQTGKASSSMSVYAMPVRFAHARPGTGDDADDTQQIAEVSVWLPQSGRLVVLGAPQTKTVLYTAVGGVLVAEKTVDGVAVFPRTHRLVKGRYADGVQVRDANNVALTPPGVWGAADFSLTGPGSLWSSGDGGWAKLPARGGGREELTDPGVPVPASGPSVAASR